MGRFINADEYTSTGQGILGHNMLVYCGNNPVFRIDSDGKAFDTVFDVISIGVDIVEIAANPTNLVTWGALAADVASLILPGVTGGGKIVRFVASADDLMDAAKYADDVVDSAKAICSNSTLGKTIHNAYKPIEESSTGFINRALSTVFEGVDSKMRPDAIDTAQNIIYELKPYNKASFTRAVNQTKRYLEKMGNPSDWTVIIDMYL